MCVHYTCACPLQPPPICAAAGRTLHCQYLLVRQCALPTRQRPRPSRQCRNRTGRSSLPPVHCLSTAHENQWPAGSGGKCSMLLVVSAYCSMRGGCQCTKMFKTVKSAWQHIHKQLTPHYNYRCLLASAWGRAPSGSLPVKKMCVHQDNEHQHSMIPTSPRQNQKCPRVRVCACAVCRH
jgi:hypothetical protein